MHIKFNNYERDRRKVYIPVGSRLEIQKKMDSCSDDMKPVGWQYRNTILFNPTKREAIDH